MNGGSVGAAFCEWLVLVRGSHPLDEIIIACEKLEMTSANNYYAQIPCLKHIYLEDSWVLGVIEKDNSIEFKLDAVLTEGHPEYHPPKPNEQYCYKRVILRLNNCSEVAWLERSFRRNTDASGEVDYGNIHYFNAEADILHVSGGWGELRLNCKDISLIAV